MRKSVMSKAEAQFKATEKKAKQELKDREAARKARADQVAKLRALRLEKEAADLAAEATEADVAVAEPTKSARLPKVHRRD